jgi:hypothetical protein
VPLDQSSILQQRNSRRSRIRCSQGHALERPVCIANDAQQGLRVSALRLADNGNLSLLREGIHQRLEPLPKTQRILGHLGLHLG